jgi:type IV fimbrial biogenesis protein FimT
MPGSARNAGPAQNGFTLIELLVTMTVLVILLGVGVPSFRDFIQGQRVKAAAVDIASSLILARSEAIKRNSTVVLAPAAGGWTQGWTVKDAAGTNTLQEQSAATGLTIQVKRLSDDASPASITFQASGRLTDSYTFSMVTSSAGRCVSVGPTGLPMTKTGACT